MSGAEESPEARFNAILWDETNHIRAIARGLQELSDGFAMTGNNMVAKQLWDSAAAISKSAKRLTEAQSHKLADEFEDTQRRTAETLGLVLTAALSGRLRSPIAPEELSS